LAAHPGNYSGKCVSITFYAHVLQT